MKARVERRKQKEKDGQEVEHIRTQTKEKLTWILTYTKHGVDNDETVTIRLRMQTREGSRKGRYTIHGTARNVQILRQQRTKKTW